MNTHTIYTPPAHSNSGSATHTLVSQRINTACQRVTGKFQPWRLVKALAVVLVVGLTPTLTPNLAHAQTTSITVSSDATGNQVAPGGTFTVSLTRTTTGAQLFTFDFSGGASSITFSDATGTNNTLRAGDLPLDDEIGAFNTPTTTVTNLTIVASSTSTDPIVISFTQAGVTFTPDTITPPIGTSTGGGTPPVTPPPTTTPDPSLATGIDASFNVTHYTVAEGDSFMANVTLASNVPSGMYAEVRVSAIEATSGSDRAIAGREFATLERPVRIEAGENSTLVEIRTLENNVYYSAGNSTFSLMALANGQSTAASATANITDNDAIPQLVVEGPRRIAPGRNGTFTVRSLTSVIPGDLNIDIGLNGTGFTRFYVPGTPGGSPPTDPATSNSSAVALLINPLTDRVSFNVTAVVPANASVEVDPIVASFTATGGAGTEYNVTHGRGSVIATAQVAASGLNPVALNEVILPQAVAAVIDQTGQAIASRSQNSFGDDGYARGFTIGGQDPLGFVSTLAKREATREAAENPWDSPDSLGRQSLSLTDLASDGDLSLVLPLNRGEGGGSFTIWAEAFTRSIDGDQAASGGSGAGNPIEFDGEVPGAIFGADARVGENLLAGIAVASATADFEYVTLDDTGTRLTGTHETELSSYHPYFGYRTEGGTNVWANLGVGEGEVTISERGGAAAGGVNYVGEVETLSYAVGFTNLRDAREDGSAGLALNYHGDVSFASVEEAPTARTRNSGAFDGARGSDISQTRARLGARLSHTRQSADGEGESRSSLGLAFRYDDGDTAEGGAVEIDAGVGVTLGDNLRLDLSGRTLLFHEESVDDWGVSGGFVWRGNPTGLGRGLTLAVTPEWGNTASRADAVLGGADAGYGGLFGAAGASADAVDAGDVGARYGFDVQYGLAVFGDGLLVPYVSGDAGDVASAVYGGRYSFGGFAAGVEAEAGDDAGEAFLRYSREF